MKKLMLVICIILMVGAGGVGLAAFRFLNTAASSSEGNTIFEVAPGESFRAIAHRLEERGLIKSATFLRLYARFTGQETKMRVGEYEMALNVKPKEVMEIITSGKSVEHTITISEGLNIFEIAEVFASAKLCTRQQALAIFKDKDLVHSLLGEDHETLEGYLFPETYSVTKYTAARSLVKQMVGRFLEVYSRLSQLPGWNRLQLSRHELVTLASIVEKETGAPEERPVISSVFYNRLKLKMRLQTDPTIIYGIWEKLGRWNGSIGRVNRETPTRYNTYTVDGLPFGPIANPGMMALKAAGLPATSEYLFFVSHLDGTSTFSKSLKQHDAAVVQYLSDRKKNDGKSWRDLQNRKDAPAQVREAEAVATGRATGKSMSKASSQNPGTSKPINSKRVESP